MMQLPEPLLKALDEQQGRPLQLVDPRTNVMYLLVRADVSEEDEDDLEGIDVGRLIADAMREDDENDPLLDSYQEDRPVP